MQHLKFEHKIMQQMSTKMQQIIKWRRAKIMELLSKGENNQSEIARILQVDKSIICRDIAYLRQKAKSNIKKYIDERLPEEYEKCLVGLNAITKEAWNTATNTEDKREKIQALSLAKECYSMKLDLLTNATVVDDAIRFVVLNKSKDKEKLKSSINNNEENRESNEPDYDENEDQLEEEQEEKTGEMEKSRKIIAKETRNQVF
jgi:Trp operon repressor